jgi:hypothetical protein
MFFGGPDLPSRARPLRPQPALGGKIAPRGFFLIPYSGKGAYDANRPAKRESNGMSDDDHKQPGEEVLLDLNFVPEWAREPATRNPYADYTGGGGRDRGGERPGRGAFRDRGARPERGGGRPERGPRRDGPDGRGGPPRRRGDEDRAFGGREPVAAGRGAPGPHRGRPGAPRSAPELACDISFLPDRRGLGAAVHRIQSTRQAYPLAQLAHMFLSRPTLYLVKIEQRMPRRAGPEGAPAPERPPLFQCTLCQAVFTARDTAESHAATAHVEHFFAVEEAAGDPPTGQFVCVVRCPRSGRLLGPPNHHGFNEALTELHAERFGHLPLPEYRATLEMAHEPEAIEQWKQEYARRRVYRRKPETGAVDPAPPAEAADPAPAEAGAGADAPAADAPPVKWADVRVFMRERAPGLIRETRRAVLPAPVAAEMSDGALRRVVREAWTREDRFPFSLMLALRPALRHMGLHFFKAGSVSFVTAQHPSPINPEYAVPTIRHALDYLAAHPGVTRAQMRHDLFPGRPDDDPECVELERDLRWLVDKGHVIEFFNGTLSIPRGAPASAPRIPAVRRGR